MDRLACIDLKAFPLQLLLKREPAWAEKPVAVVEADKPNARIRWLNERARECGILPGMRYAAGLALAADLCAGVVSEADIEKGVASVAKRLRSFGPDVEPCAHEPGVFWLGARGMDLLFPSLRLWAVRVRAALERIDLSAGVVVGFERFFTYALARSLRDSRTHVLKDPTEERACARRVPLNRLHLAPAARDGLFALGVRTIGDLSRLPPAGLCERFGAETYRLWRAARGEDRLPVQPEAEEEPLRGEMILDDGERDVTRLLFSIKRLLDPLLARLAARRQALAGLTLELKLERGPGHVEQLRPADPTLDARQLLDLVLLRLEALRLEAGVIELAVSARGISATQEQLELFRERPRRDPAAQKRAFARLRAEFGEHAVACAGLREGHLPEASFAWTPLDALPRARPRLCRRTLVRRLRAQPYALPRRPRHEEDGWQLRGRDDAAVEDLHGPYVVSGGWWRSEVSREYYFARTRKGEWLWVYCDKHRRRWYLQGRVE
ncbi:MAG: Y-family DNA polymerase [Planctomycetota bacterium]